MNERTRILFILLVLALVIAACTSVVGNGSDAPSSDEQVATIVAGTLQALTPGAGGSPTEEPALILPHSLYFLGRDGAGLMQVFSKERDGSTTRQLTFEPVDVSSYDVSLVDGSVTYVANNQLLWSDANGAGRRVLLDAGAPDPIDPLFSTIRGVAYSPDGQTIAYGLRGINIYSLPENSSNVVLPQRPADIALGQPAEVYWPINYSPDGTKLLVTAVIPNSDGVSTVILVTNSDAPLIRLVGEGGFFCCSKHGWTADSSAAYFANPSVGMLGSGMWRVDAASGVITTLVPSEAGGGMYNLPDEPFLAPDGQLYYFFTTSTLSDGFIDRSPLQLVRSAVDGVTGRTVLRSDSFQLMNEALWAPDASFVIVAFAPTTDVRVGGQAEITYVDGRPSVILTTFAQDMKWGP